MRHDRACPFENWEAICDLVTWQDKVKKSNKVEPSDVAIHLEVVAAIILPLLHIASSRTIELHVTLDRYEPEAVPMKEDKEEPVDDELRLLLRSYRDSGVFDIIVVVILVETTQEFLSSVWGHV